MMNYDDLAVIKMMNYDDLVQYNDACTLPLPCVYQDYLIYYNKLYLVGGLEHEFYDFPYIGNVIIPTDELIFFRGLETTNQYICMHMYLINV